MEALISVIVPVYNKERFLDKLIPSLLNQTYSNLEIILVNDGSSDRSLQICQQYARQDKRIKLISQKNQGVSAARNAGLKVAAGEYIGFVDADDYILPDMYDSLLKHIRQYRAQIAACGFNCQGKIVSYREGLFPAKQFLKQNMKGLNVWNKLFQKELVANLFFDETLRYAEDMLFCATALLKARYIFNDARPLYVYNRNAQSATQESFSAEQLASFHVFKKLQMLPVVAGDKSLYRALEMYKTYNMVGFLRGFISQNYRNKHVIRLFLNTIRRNIVCYLFSPYPIWNRLFALTAAINFKLSKHIYQLIFGACPKG